MIVSRALPSMIRLNHVIKLNSVAKTELNNSPRHFMKILCPGRIQRLQIKTMSTDVDKELNDPKRHFDYKQLVDKKEKENVVVIDVREHSEIKETGKIPGSIHIPLAELGKALGELSPEEFQKSYNAAKPQKNTEIIFSCKAGGRSLKALKLGLELGYTKAGNYKGGWLDWAEKSGQSK